MSKTEESLLGAFEAVAYDAWREQVEKGLKGADFGRKLVTRTAEGIEVQPLYTEADWAPQGDRAGLPGAPPYRRGAHSLGRHADNWEARVRYDNPDPAALAEELRADREREVRSVWLVLDAEARSGAASAAPQERGAACLTAAQLGATLEPLALDRVRLSIDAGGSALPAAACLLAAADARGVVASKLQGWLNADPLAALAADGALPGSLDAARAQLIALASHCADNAPGLRAVTVSTHAYHDAGASAVQELGFALATGVTYLRWLTDAGLPLERACEQLAFSVSVGSDFFMEVAKLRALRQCWSQVVAACGGDAEAQRCVVHAASSARSKTRRDPYVNMLRETTEAFSAAVGGADAITTCGFDRALGASAPLARRIAQNAQVILDEESHVSQIADPGGGSYYVESLTDQVAAAGWKVFQSIERDGGMPQAITAGVVASQIEEVARARAKDIAKRKQAVTGVSEFANVAEEPVERSSADAAALSAVRKQALSVASERAELAAVGAAQGAAQVAAAVAAAAAGATLAQLSAALGGGEAASAPALPVRRHADAFEALRDACDAHVAAGKARPKVFSCNLGPIPKHKARAQFALGFLNAGGLEVTDNDGFDSAEAAAAGLTESGAPLAVICGGDDQYAEEVAKVAPALKAAGAKRIILAGRPGDAEASYREAGVKDFIFMGSDVVQALKGLLSEIGVSA